MRYLFVLLLAGCATHPVLPYGPDTYIITSDDNTGLTSRGRTQARALKRANAHCEKLDKVMQVKDLNATGNIWVGSSASLVFTCVER